MAHLSLRANFRANPERHFIADTEFMTLGDNRRVDLSQTLIFMTSNLGGSEISELMEGGMGFAPAAHAESNPQLDEKVERTATEAAKRKFAPEFMNRIDKVVVFRPLRSQQLEQILEIELGMVQQRLLETNRPFLFRLTPAARKFLLREGTDLKYGARHLKRAIQRHVVWPLASLRASDQLALGDVISIDWDGSDTTLNFSKRAERAPVQLVQPAPERVAHAVAVSDGLEISLAGTSAAICWREEVQSGSYPVSVAEARTPTVRRLS